MKIDYRISLTIFIIMLFSCKDPLMYEVIADDDKLYRNKNVYVNSLEESQLLVEQFRKEFPINKNKYEWDAILSVEMTNENNLLVKGVIKHNHPLVDKLIFELGNIFAEEENRKGSYPKGAKVKRIYVAFHIYKNGGWSYIIKNAD